MDFNLDLDLDFKLKFNLDLNFHLEGVSYDPGTRPECFFCTDSVIRSNKMVRTQKRSASCTGARKKRGATRDSQLMRRLMEALKEDEMPADEDIVPNVEAEAEQWGVATSRA